MLKFIVIYLRSCSQASVKIYPQTYWHVLRVPCQVLFCQEHSASYPKLDSAHSHPPLLAITMCHLVIRLCYFMTTVAYFLANDS